MPWRCRSKIENDTEPKSNSLQSDSTFMILLSDTKQFTPPPFFGTIKKYVVSYELY